MASSHEIIGAVTTISESCTLATIIRVEGSSYLKEGAMMVIREDGTRLGMLSAGCVEEDLYHHSQDVAFDKWSIHQFYTGDEDDLSWGIGCNGVLHVLLEKVTSSYRESLQRVKAYLDQGQHVWMVKHLTASKTLFLSENGDVFGSWDEDIPSLLEWKNGFHQGIYMQCLLPQPRLFIFGAGEDAKPLVRFAKETDFFTTVCDWREGLCTPLRFPEADSCIVGFPKEVMSRLAITERDFVVIMTHHFIRDQEILTLLLQRTCRYLGILGSRQRTARLFREMEKPAWISAPVGLPIGARGPAEIAVSIIAEMIQIVRMEQNENSRNILGSGKQQENGTGNA